LKWPACFTPNVESDTGILRATGLVPDAEMRVSSLGVDAIDPSALRWVMTLWKMPVHSAPAEDAWGVTDNNGFRGAVLLGVAHGTDGDAIADELVDVSAELDGDGEDALAMPGLPETRTNPETVTATRARVVR
jgi:hypothetical protein